MVVSVAMLALAACGSSPTATPTATPAPQATPTATVPNVTNANGQRIVAVGNTVSVNYTGKLDDGTVFDSSDGKAPLTFVVGSGQMIEGFDLGVRGMTLNEKKTITLTPDQAYGAVDSTPPQTVQTSQLPPDVTVGDTFVPAAGYTARVLNVFGDYAWVEFNSDLAGKTLTFDIQVVSIQ